MSEYDFKAENADPKFYELVMDWNEACAYYDEYAQTEAEKALYAYGAWVDENDFWRHPSMKPGAQP